METKRTASFRLSQTTLKELESLAKRNGISQADVIAVVVHCVYAYGDVDADRLSDWFEIAKLS